MKRFDLNEAWLVHEAPLHWERENLAAVKALKDGWYACTLPTDVRIPLIEHGIIQDPVKSDYALSSEWIEQRSWWYTKEFDGSSLDFESDIIELVIETIDSHSDIFVNGQYVGSHYNVHYPFIYNVRDLLTSGKNTIDVRVTTGLEKVTDTNLAELNWATCREYDNGGKDRGDYRRSFVRRPQYTVGWDWGPRVVTCGLAGNAYLRSEKKIAIREVNLVTASISGSARLKATVNIENLDLIGTTSGNLLVDITYEGKSHASKKLENLLLTSGTNYVEFDLEIENPQLWWPQGYGDHPLYEVKVAASCGDVTTEYPEFQFGIRTIELDTSIIRGEERNFRLIVNGTPIFSKGGNWIPNDFIYARVPEEKYVTLIREAVEANFNMLRVWGGGLFERDIFYNLCDQNGLLVWQDFMLACSTYPDHRREFVDEMHDEMDYQTKRLRNHACLALFCGTNEVHWIFNEIDNPRWKIKIKHEKQYGLYIANVLAKEIIHSNCSQIPYWNSSPYGGALPNADTVGDVHRWHNAFMSLDLNQRIEPKDFDGINSKFVSEYGYVGPTTLESTIEFLDGKEIDFGSSVWEMHNNVFEKGTVVAGIRKNYLDVTDNLSLEDYLLYGGMVHSLMLEYSLEAMRFQPDCSGALFWMYNDAWGEVGWTIIDYYLRRKISYYGVKRALAHTKLSLRTVDGKVVLQGMNDTAEKVQFQAEFGYISFDGSTRETRTLDITLEPHSRSYVLTEQLPDHDYSKGSIMVISDTEAVATVALRTADMKTLQFERAGLTVVSDEQAGADRKVTLKSDGYVHGVYVQGSYDCSDLYFDLLPGELKTITIYGAGSDQLQFTSVR
ncbi:beta-mannosidase [Bacillus sp. FJAT-27264]|uniref:glycoside hydrolase family 2 protein n=1 Tax=Paenibacillus sp. (strain DSM 101736 / FJAT-27264) TaxID=1850362 RepID=UPI000807E724|nr:sugar-binding domain-containing protein [Bacillus sp. FJAT-27264]OBZ14978.1 beta-mannosidase [Bacillus sp. FJAT-27264]